MPDTALSHEQMRRALHDSESRLRSVVNSASMVLWAVDADGTFTFSEGRGLEALGLRAGEVVGRSVRDVYSGDEKILDDLRRALAGEEFTTVREVGGIVFESRYTPMRNVEGEITGVIGIGVDITSRRRAEEAQGQTLSLLRATLESTADGILVVDAAGRISTYNRKFAEMWELPQSVMDSGDDELAIAHVLGQLRDPDAFVAKVRDLYAQPEAASSDVLEFIDGRVFERYSQPQRIGDRTVGRVWSFRDVTERRRADDALRRAEAVLKRSNDELEAMVAERTSELARTNRALEAEIAERQRAQEELNRRSAELEAIFLALPDLYFRLAGDGRILAHRSGRDSSLVLAEDAYIGTRIQDLLPESARDELADALRLVSSSGSAFYRMEYSLPFDQQGERHFEVRILPFAEGQVITIVRDITARQRAELALRSSEEHYRRLIENSSDVATILGPDGINRYQSPAIQYVLGYTPDEMEGTSAFERIHPDDVPACREVLGEVMRNPGITRSVEFRYRHRDGSWRVLEARARTLLPDSASEGAVINSRDVTERRRYEQELELAKEEAENANRAKSEFLSRMSHELRTPMNSILGFGQLLERKDLPADQRKSVEHILKAGRHLLNLINEVLEIARIEAGRQNISVEPVRIATAVQEARALIQPLALQSDLILEEFTVDEALYVRADRQRLVQVLLNLLSNAVKYNRPGGRVGLSCLVIEEDGRQLVRIGIQDSGDGIPPEKVGRLFMPFERLGAEQGGVEGTGLGLALSQRLAEAMGGRLLLDTVPGEGSTFWVELQRVTSPIESAVDGLAASSGTAGSQVPRPPATILYIEDNLPNLALIETILAERSEITLLSAVQGKIGVYLAAEHRPRLILLDMHLPDIHGDEVLRQLQADPRTAEIPVVIVSADATPKTLERLARAGAAAYLTKPLDVAEFLATVDRFITVDGR